MHLLIAQHLHTFEQPIQPKSFSKPVWHHKCMCGTINVFHSIYNTEISKKQEFFRVQDNTSRSCLTNRKCRVVIRAGAFPLDNEIYHHLGELWKRAGWGLMNVVWSIWGRGSRYHHWQNGLCAEWTTQELVQIRLQTALWAWVLVGWSVWADCWGREKHSFAKLNLLWNAGKSNAWFLHFISLKKHSASTPSFSCPLLQGFPTSTAAVAF